MSREDNSVVFGLGLLVGIVGGVIAGVLYAPKSGEETRKDLQDAVVDFADKHTPEINEAKRQALTSIDVMKYKIEKKYNKISNIIKAKQLARAKERESVDYDMN